jgi:hypothetical protein
MRSFFCRLLVVARMAVLVAVAVTVLGISGRVQADWPQYRGDSQRSARAADPLPLPLQLSGGIKHRQRRRPPGRPVHV